jgi:hypothetical protein
VSSDRPCAGTSGIDRSVDIPANAKPKGNHRPCTAEEVSECLRIYPASVPRTWTVKLYAQPTLFVGRKRLL